jgi:sortase (surface protein transpeptidase)
MLLGDPPPEPIPVIKGRAGDDWWDPAWDADWWGPRWDTVTPGLSDLVVKPRTPEAGPPPSPAGPTPQGLPGAAPAVKTPPAEPSWARVLITTISLWTSRRRSRTSRGRLLAASVLGAGVLAVAAGAAGLAVAGGPSVTSVPRPAPPTPIATPSGPAVNPVELQTTALPAAPVSLTIPAIGVKTSLVRLGLQANGTLQVPGSTTVAGWYTGSPRPGAAGSAVIAGHVDSRYGPGIFFWLRTMRPGERIYVKRADGTLAVFTVTGVRTYPKDQFPTAAVYGPAPDAELRLITCGGLFDQSVGSYLSNVVVFARLTA